MWIKSNVKPTALLICPRHLGRNLAQKMFIFLSSNLDKPVFHKNLGVLFIKYSDACVGNTLLVHDTLYKSLSNGPYNVIFVETFDSSIGSNNNYLLGAILPYFKAL
jgi:hypothetical protein